MKISQEVLKKISDKQIKRMEAKIVAKFDVKSLDEVYSLLRSKANNDHNHEKLNMLSNEWFKSLNGMSEVVQNHFKNVFNTAVNSLSSDELLELGGLKGTASTDSSVVVSGKPIVEPIAKPISNNKILTVPSALPTSEPAVVVSKGDSEVDSEGDDSEVDSEGDDSEVDSEGDSEGDDFEGHSEVVLTTGIPLLGSSQHNINVGVASNGTPVNQEIVNISGSSKSDKDIAGESIIDQLLSQNDTDSIVNDTVVINSLSQIYDLKAIKNCAQKVLTCKDNWLGNIASPVCTGQGKTSVWVDKAIVCKEIFSLCNEANSDMLGCDAFVVVTDLN